MEEVVADKTVEWQQNLEQAFSMLFRLQGEGLQEAVKQVSLLGCLALKAGKEQEAEQCFEKLLEVDLAKVTPASYLAAVKNMLVMAARMRKEELFTAWLTAALKPVNVFVQAEEKQKVAEFVLVIVFTACDRRFLSALPVLNRLVNIYLRACNDAQALQEFFSEWTSLIAQFARRNWTELSKFLLRVLLKELLRRKDLPLTQLVLLKLNMHMQMYSRWDSFANAFAVYEELQYFYLLLLKRAGNVKIAEAERSRYLVLTLRSIRDWVANVSRTNMQDDLNILREWRDLLKEKLSANVQLWVDILVQLEINYWHLTKPKTSRKQLEYLADLLEPDVVTEEYKKLLQKLV